MTTLGRPEMTAESVVRILGVRFDALTLQESVERILFWVDEKSRRMVVTAGPEFVMMAQKDTSVLELVNRADLVTPDGVGIIYAAKWLGQRIAERVTGVEMVIALLRTAEHRHHALRVYVLGAAEESLRACLDKLRADYPTHEFTGRNGYFTSESIHDLKDEISAFEPHLLLVGLGQPRQERFIYETLGSLPACVGIGVGGSIDVWGGRVKRAPTVFRAMNLEWLYRLVSQPARWRRQLALPRFAWKVLRKSASRA